METPKKIKNKELYIKIRKEVKKEIPKHSAYRSAYIIKRYIEEGEKQGFEESDLIDKKEEKKSGLKRWFMEHWVCVAGFLAGRIIKCGDPECLEMSACRPLIRVNSETPVTIIELLKKYPKEKIIEAIKLKNSDPQNKIIFWDDLRVVNKK